MPEEEKKALSPAEAVVDLELAEAVNQLVWLIADEFVEQYSEAMWLNEMLPEPGGVKVRTAGQS